MKHEAIVGQLSEFPISGMREVEVDGEKFLLVRRSETISAIDGKCPHAGGPLAEGVLDGDQVICPWHKAAFCVRDGKRLQPPAVDDLRSFPVEIRGDDIVLILSDEQISAQDILVSDDRCFVVLGGGAAGAAAVQELRALGFAGKVILVDHEGRLPYDRTILSKYTLSGETGGEKTPLQDEAFYRRNAIERRTAEVTALDVARRTISFADGGVLDYDAALIATGAIPVPPPFPGGNLQGVFLLRSQADVERIVEMAERSKQAVVIGANFIGMEAAAALRERGLDVTVVVSESAPFEKQLGARIGTVFQQLHESKGVRFRFNAKIERLEGDVVVERLVLAGDESIEADIVIAGLGVKPATGFVERLARPEDHGLVVDASMRVADGLYAAGDVAAFPYRGDGVPVRVEHWRVAEQHGRVAARSMMDLKASYDAVPYFWTIQYMKRLDYVGHASAKDKLVVRGDLGKAEFIAYYLRDGAVMAAAGLNQDRDMAAVLALMGEQRDWKLDELHPPNLSPSAVLDIRRGNQN